MPSSTSYPSPNGKDNLPYGLCAKAGIREHIHTSTTEVACSTARGHYVSIWITSGTLSLQTLRDLGSNPPMMAARSTDGLVSHKGTNLPAKTVMPSDHMSRRGEVPTTASSQHEGSYHV